MKKFRIAVFNYGLPTPGEKHGGVDRVAHDLAEGLAERGHHVTVWTLDPKPAGAAYEVQELPFKSFISSWLGRRVTMGYLGNFISLLPRYLEADVIIAHGDSLLMPLLGRPLIRVMHGSALGEACSSKSALRFIMQLGIYPLELLSALTQVSVGVSQNTVRYNPFVRRVIPNGIDLQKFGSDINAMTKHPSILFVGTLGGRKRGYQLLKWFTEVIQVQYRDATLDMVSASGPELEGVTYHTGIETEELALLYRRSWVYASPSTYEGFGIPYIEAMASGTPVVASMNPGSHEVLEGGRYGRIVKDEDFAEEVCHILFDCEARDALSKKGLLRAEAFSLGRMIDSYEKMIEELVRNGSGQYRLR
ncbi:MAG: glycosyltransferase family 4 protein [Pyrinomonadaceae bacterium]